MQVIDKDETRDWLSNIGLLNSEGGISLSEFLEPVSYAIPGDSGLKTALSKALTSFFEQEEESLLWINEFGIWPSSEDQNLFYGFRISLGENSKLSEKPSHIFHRSELDAVVSLLSMVFYFCWGAIIVPQSRRFVFRISHDECIDIFARNEIILSQIQETLDELLRTS